MYIPQSRIVDVNGMRYQLFHVRDGHVESGQLPPCKDCLEMHIIKANYQSCVQNRSLEVQPSIPNPVDYTGRIFDDEAQLQIN